MYFDPENRNIKRQKYFGVSLTRSRSETVAFKAPSGRPKGKQYLQIKNGGGHHIKKQSQGQVCRKDETKKDCKIGEAQYILESINRWLPSFV